ncbi:MAG: TetR/AcrR family transcriptional regulator [Actinobacteria bacterium]|nr:TetR/AcrR family transcriptional regulator [Actinomycetota bacterium]
MGRIAGVTADQTRERMLAAAASVFARGGYDGASIAELASEAGVSSGAIYSHFGSKAELFAATLQTHGSTEVAALLAFGATPNPVEFLTQRGRGLAHRRPEEGSLLVQAIVAARRHPDVAALLISAFSEREGRIADMLRSGQVDGLVDSGVPAAAAARFVLMLALGSLLVAAMELPSVDPDDWAQMITDVVSRFIVA